MGFMGRPNDLPYRRRRGLHRAGGLWSAGRSHSWGLTSTLQVRQGSDAGCRRQNSAEEHCGCAVVEQVAGARLAVTTFSVDMGARSSDRGGGDRQDDRLSISDLGGARPRATREGRNLIIEASPAAVNLRTSTPPTTRSLALQDGASSIICLASRPHAQRLSRPIRACAPASSIAAAKGGAGRRKPASRRRGRRRGAGTLW